MTPEIFSTRALRPRDQFKAWREWYQPVLDVLADDTTREEFRGETRMWRLGGFSMSRTIAPPVYVVRARGNLRQDPVDHWVVSYCVRGAHLAKTAGGMLEVPQKVPFVWSLGQEFLHERTRVDRIQFFLPRDVFRDVAPLLDAALGSTLNSPLGHLLGDYMIALEQRLPVIRDADLPRLANAVGAMVAAAVAPSAERVAVARGQIDLSRKERVRQAVRRHLRTPTLGPRTLCRLVGMSRSNLYRLFEDTGGVARFIQRERLLEAHAVLTDLANAKSISAIAEDLCFADASSFSRTFKREFGYSPTEARYAAISGRELGVTRRTRVPSAASDFVESLRRF